MEDAGTMKVSTTGLLFENGFKALLITPAHVSSVVDSLEQSALVCQVPGASPIATTSLSVDGTHTLKAGTLCSVTLIFLLALAKQV